jgi:hypothetical protein
MRSNSRLSALDMKIASDILPPSSSSNTSIDLPAYRGKEQGSCMRRGTRAHPFAERENRFFDNDSDKMDSIYAGSDLELERPTSRMGHVNPQ